MYQIGTHLKKAWGRQKRIPDCRLTIGDCGKQGLGEDRNVQEHRPPHFRSGLRLTFVEYFKNAGYEGKGIKYNPVK